MHEVWRAICLIFYKNTKKILTNYLISNIQFEFLILGLEELFYRYGVDLEIWAHEHSYERLWPIYDYNVYNGSYENPYVNPT